MYTLLYNIDWPKNIIYYIIQKVKEKSKKKLTKYEHFMKYFFIVSFIKNHHKMWCFYFSKNYKKSLPITSATSPRNIKISRKGDFLNMSISVIRKNDIIIFFWQILFVYKYFHIKSFFVVFYFCSTNSLCFHSFIIRDILKCPLHRIRKRRYISFTYVFLAHKFCLIHYYIFYYEIIFLVFYFS